MLAVFSGKTPHWIVQMPAFSIEVDEGVEKRFADAAAACCGVDVDGVFDDAGVNASVGDGYGGRPAQDGGVAVVDGDKAMLRHALTIEVGPGGRSRLKGGVASSIPA
jgi:hypothetical protein